MKKKIFYLIIFSLSISFCFIITEYIISNYYIPQSDDYYHEFDPILGWKPIPGCYEYKPQNSFGSHIIHINRFGIRNKEISSFRDKNTKRIIVLGDSFTFGKAVSNEVLFTTVLEKILNKKVSRANKYKYEIINAGAPAYGTGQQLLMMRYLADNGIVGDIYLLMMFTNDISDNVRLLRNNLNTYAPGFVLDNNGKLILKYLPKQIELAVNNKTMEGEVEKRIIEENGARSFMKSFIKSISNLKTIEFLKDRIGTLLQTKPGIVKPLIKLGLKIDLPPIPTTLQAWYSDDILSPGIPLLKTLLSEINKEAINKDAKLLVALIPSQIDVYSDIFIPIIEKAFSGDKMTVEWLKNPLRPQNVTRDLCSTQKIPFLDLNPELRKNNNNRLYLYKDGHFNELGHNIVAKSLATFLLENTN